MTPVFYKWPKLTAFDAKTVGSKVVDSVGFLNALSAAVEAFDFNAETNEHVTTTGQGAIPLNDALACVSAGVGPKCNVLSRYVLREWRGEIKPYLLRDFAALVDNLIVIVYTVEAYLADPQVDASERTEIEKGQATTFNIRVGLPSGYTPFTHVIVAVLANAGPKPPAYSPGRLVANLAGGNNDALAWDADTIRGHAQDAQAYAAEWSVVAD